MQHQAIHQVTNGCAAQMLSEHPEAMNLSDYDFERMLGGRLLATLQGARPMQLLSDYELSDVMTNGGTGLAGLDDLGKFKIGKALKKVGKVVKKVAKVAVPVVAGVGVAYGASALLNRKKKKKGNATPPIIAPVDAAAAAFAPQPQQLPQESNPGLLSQGVQAATAIYTAKLQSQAAAQGLEPTGYPAPNYAPNYAPQSSGGGQAAPSSAPIEGEYLPAAAGESAGGALSSIPKPVLYGGLALAAFLALGGPKLLKGGR